MRRHLLLPVIFLVLFLFGTATAQWSLVEYNDKNDPCNPFKIRILVPVNNADPKLLFKSFKGGIDSRMVLNPCPRNEQYSLTLQQAPVRQRSFSRLGSPGFQSSVTNKDPKNRSEFQFAESPPVFKFEWRPQ